MDKSTKFVEPVQPFYAPPEWVWLLVNLLIPVIGVLFLHWNLFVLLYLFWMEFIMIGAFGALGILLAYNGKKYYLASLVPKLFSLLAFVVLFGGLIMLVVAFSLQATDLDALFDDSNFATDSTGFGWALVALFLSFLLDFLANYVLPGTFRRAFHMPILMYQFIRVMPLTFVIIFGLVPLAGRMEGHQANVILILGILLAKTLIEFLSKKGRNWVVEKAANSEIELS